ncbi:MAG: hypothetical protein IKH26_04985 [Bacteroidaceae bacterium]|nr:hypothetical protein [Bacteroidaceae bacterium]
MIPLTHVNGCLIAIPGSRSRPSCLHIGCVLGRIAVESRLSVFLSLYIYALSLRLFIVYSFTRFLVCP